MKKKILDFITKSGIRKCGVTVFEGKSAIVCLFPYFNGCIDGNLSLYARSYDYHKVIKEKLSPVCDYIESLSPDAGCEIFADIGPSVDRALAYKAGLGFYGKNGMLINDTFGSWFFIGYILCDLALEPDSPIEKSCLGCDKCIESCPGNALSDSFCLERCASHISQKKGELSEGEIELLRKSGLIFGCDICQRVCPHNDVPPCALDEFKKDLIHSLGKSDLEELSGREFMKKYKDRAFSWRGKGVLERNLTIIENH